MESSEFCFSDILNVSRGKAEGNTAQMLIIRGNKTDCFLRGQSLSVFLYLLTWQYKTENFFMPEHDLMTW